MEATQVAIDGCMDKQNVVYTCDGIWFSLQEEEILQNEEFFEVILQNEECLQAPSTQHGTWGHYAKWRKFQRDKYYMIPLIWGPLSSKDHRDRK